MLCNVMNKRQNVTDNVIDSLRNSPNKYYLTGSRYFGNTTDKSDWDFFVQDSQEVRTELKKLGFTHDARSYMYIDHLISSVWCRLAANVHVQLVTDVELKEKAQLLIFGIGSLPKNKSERVLIWNRAINFARETKVTPPTRLTKLQESVVNALSNDRWGEACEHVRAAFESAKLQIDHLSVDILVHFLSAIK